MCLFVTTETRDYPCTCDIRAFIASCSPSCESVTYSFSLCSASLVRYQLQFT